MSKEFKVGLLVVVAGAVLYLGFNFLKGKDFFSTSKSFQVQYENVDGLTVSNPVILNGFTVGRVESIDILHEENDNLLVTFAVEQNVAVNNKTVAELASSDLLGGKAIKLYINDGDVLLENDAFVKPKQEESLMALLESKAVPVISNVDTLVESFKDYLRGENEKTITKALADLGKSMENIQKSTVMLAQIMAQNKGNLNTMTTEFANLGKELNLTMKEFNPIMTKLNTFTDTLNNIDVNSTLSSANNAMASVQQLMTAVNGKDGSLGKLMHTSTLHNNLNVTLRDIDYLVTDMQANPGRYIQLSVIGGRAKNERAIIKTNKRPLPLTSVTNVALKRDAPSLLVVKLYKSDRTVVEIVPNGLGTKNISFNLPPDFTKGEYLLKLDWMDGSESIPVIVQ